MPLDIDYDADLEDEIASAVMRLDELGDLIDGEFRPGRSISCWRHFGPDIRECDTRDDGLIERDG